MADRMRVVIGFAILTLVSVAIQLGATQIRPITAGTIKPAANFSDHPAVGAWFGKAIQICLAGNAASNCEFGNPAITLFMTPQIWADGNFIGNDHLAVASPPLGPHTTAHGSWLPVSPSEFQAD